MKEKPICGAKSRRTGEPCKQTILGKNGRCKMHGAKAGAPAENQNRTTHGLYAKSLDEHGLEVYAQAKDTSADDIARDTAEFLVAKVASAYREMEPEDVTAAKGVIGGMISDLVDQGAMSAKAAATVLSRLQQPELHVLARALAPLKGLLELKKEGNNTAAADWEDALEQLESRLNASGIPPEEMA